MRRMKKKNLHNSLGTKFSGWALASHVQASAFDLYYCRKVFKVSVETLPNVEPCVTDSPGLPQAGSDRAYQIEIGSAFISLIQM